MKDDAAVKRGPHGKIQKAIHVSKCLRNSVHIKVFFILLIRTKVVSYFKLLKMSNDLFSLIRTLYLEGMLKLVRTKV